MRLRDKDLPGVFRVCTMFLAGFYPLFAVENPRLEYALGMHARFHGDADAALEHFESARLAAPQAAPLVRTSVEHLLATGDRAGAIRIYQDLASGRPDDLPVQLSYVDFITELDENDALARKLAIETLEAVLVKNPGHPQIIRRLVFIHTARGDEASARKFLDKLSENDPVATLLYASLSRRLYDKDDAVARAVVDERLLRVVETHPQDAALAHAASDHFKNTGRVELAIDVLKRHTQSAPWSLQSRVRLGILQFSAKQDKDGEATLKEVLSIHPYSALAHQTLAKFYRLRDQSDKAGFHARELLKIRGGSSAESIKLAEERMAAGDPREARLLLEKAVFDHPDEPGLVMKLAIATHRDPGTRARAPRLFREAEAASPDGKITDPGFLMESAEAFIESGQSKAAEERLRAAIRAFPVDAKKDTAAALRVLAGLWLKENRNADAARSLFQRADALDPK